MKIARRTSIGPLTSTMLAVALLAGAALAATPVKVRDADRLKEWGGSAIDGWFAWEANTRAHPRVFKVYVQPDGGTKQRVALAGTTRSPSLIASGHRAGQVVFQALGLHKGDIRFYDPVAEQVLRAPRTINTAKHEEYPEADGDYLTFDRYDSSRWNTIIYRFSTKTSIVIGHRMIAGQLNGDYAVYMRCAASTCDVQRYRISAGRFTTMPAAASGRANYWPAVMADGTVYYVQGSRNRCGRNTRILRFHAGAVTTVAKVPDGTELAAMEARTVNGTDQLLVTEVTCGSGGAIRDTGIYAVAI
jgi:hypothetical protein